MTSGGKSLVSEVRDVTKTIERGLVAWEQDDFGLALACFQMVLAEHPGFPDVRNKAALCLAMLGDMSGALQQLDEALRINDDYVEAHLNRAIVLNELGRFDEARASFDRASLLEQERGGEFPAEIGNQLAIAHAKVADLYLSCSRPGRAVDEYRLALDVRPGFLDIRSKLAEAYLEMGRLGEAQEELESILRQNPEFTAARTRLGMVYLRSGDSEAAIREWTRCAAEDPADLRVQAYLASLRPTTDGAEHPTDH